MNALHKETRNLKYNDFMINMCGIKIQKPGMKERKIL